MADQLSSDLASLKIDRDAPPPSGSKKLLVTIALVAAAGVGVYLFAVPALKAKWSKPTVTALEISMVSPSQASIELSSTGYVVPQVTSKIAAKEGGRLAKVNFKEGDLVKKGDVVALLDDTDKKSLVVAGRSRVSTAAARAQAARASLAEVELQLKREKALVEKGVSPPATAEDLAARAVVLQRTAGAADAEVRAAQADLDAASVGLENMTITSPIDGLVIARPLDVGDVVNPMVGRPIMDLVDMNSLTVECDVPESRLSLVKSGAPTEILLDAYPTKIYRGAVKEISPKINRAKATVLVRVSFVDPTEGVLPEMSARVSFLSAKAGPQNGPKEPARLVVPTAAVADRAGAKVVFVIDDDKVRMVPIKVGPAFGGGLEVIEGPPAGTRVVKEPAATLQDGTAIKLKTT